MKVKDRFLYIGIASYFGIALLLSGCTGDEKISSSHSEDVQTPLMLEPTLSIGHAVTRASGETFGKGDQLNVYFRHTTGGTKGNYTISDNVSSFSQLVKINALNPSGVYWEDFSKSASADTDIRTAGHALQPYYGYCYNGGTPTTRLEESTGILSWTISDQTSAEAVQNADLLWMSEQEAVAYSHDNKGGIISLPFTHAMSEITVTIKTNTTFGESPLTNTALTLYSMNTVATVNAPEGNISSSSPEDITMYGDDYTSGSSRTYTAIVAPGTALKVGDKLLDIVDVEGNNYTLTITEDMLKATAWAKEGYTEDQTKITTQSGVNYHLDANLSKAALGVVASLIDWTSVTADGNGNIAFDDDINVVTVDGEGVEFGDKAKFALYWKKNAENEEYAAATTLTYDATAKTWSYDPAIYWPNGKDSYYFRALSGIDDTAVKQGDDVLWGTTAQHNGIEAGAAIAPRTGDVPLIFEHAMSKITFDLTTTDGDDKVDLEGATISISNLYTEGTISIDDGAITVKDITEAAISNLSENTAIIVLPQTISDNAIVTILLTDGTNYKLQLNQCLDASNNAIASWERGKSYTYTITVKKEAVQFRALIQDWKLATGSGNATLDWD